MTSGRYRSRDDGPATIAIELMAVESDDGAVYLRRRRFPRAPSASSIVGRTARARSAIMPGRVNELVHVAIAARKDISLSWRPFLSMLTRRGRLLLNLVAPVSAEFAGTQVTAPASFSCALCIYDDGETNVLYVRARKERGEKKYGAQNAIKNGPLLHVKREN